jgi:hypothetical protein
MNIQISQPNVEIYNTSLQSPHCQASGKTRSRCCLRLKHMCMRLYVICENRPHINKMTYIERTLPTPPLPLVIQTILPREFSPAPFSTEAGWESTNGCWLEKCRIVCIRPLFWRSNVDAAEEACGWPTEKRHVVACRVEERRARKRAADAVVATAVILKSLLGLRCVWWWWAFRFLVLGSQARQGSAGRYFLQPFIFSLAHVLKRGDDWQNVPKWPYSDNRFN